MMNNKLKTDMKREFNVPSIKNFGMNTGTLLSGKNLNLIFKTIGRRFSATMMLLLAVIPVYSQAPAADTKVPAQFPQWAMDPVVYIVGFLFFMMCITIYVLYRVNISLIKTVAPKTFEKEKTVVVPVTSVKKVSLLRRLYLSMVDSVPVEHEKDVLLDHDYDGIKELDNNLPPWWKYGFYFTIAFGVFYLLYFHVSGIGKLQGDEYKEELAFAAQQKDARMKASKDLVNEENVTFLADAEEIAKGKETFIKLCKACHLEDGGGQVGPNLTDDYWIHGGGIKNIFKTITYGVPNKGMISWQSQLSPKQIQEVGSYIMTLKGTKPLVAKEPEGDIWKEENAMQPDSAKQAGSDSSGAATAAENKL